MRRMLVLGTLAVVLMACGGGDQRVSPTSSTVAATTTTSAPVDTTTAVTSAPAGEWRRSELGPLGADTGVVGATNGDVTVVLAGGVGNALGAWSSDSGGAFAAAPVAEIFDESANVADVTAFGDGFIAVGGGYPSFLPAVWRSADGQSWDLVETTGLGEPADLLSIVATPDGLMAAGARRTGPDPGMGPIRAAVWTSPDGVTWNEVVSPITGSDHVWIEDLIATDDGVVTLTNRDRLRAWRSQDGGASWRESEVDAYALGTVSVTSLARNGTTLIGFGTAGEDLQGDPVVMRSDDGGTTFAVTALELPIEPGLEAFGRTYLAGGAWWAISFRFVDAFTNPDVCYRDPADCAEGSGGSVLLYSADGVEWREVDLEPVTAGQYASLTAVIDTPAGATVLGAGERATAWTWDSGSDPPPEVTAWESPAIETPLVKYGGTVELGVTSRYPLYIHCGMDYLGELNGRYWYLAEAAGQTPETGAGESPPDSWPVAQQMIFGFVTLVDESTVEYSIGDGEVIATYAPSDVQPPGCE